MRSLVKKTKLVGDGAWKGWKMEDGQNLSIEIRCGRLNPKDVFFLTLSLSLLPFTHAQLLKEIILFSLHLLHSQTLCDEG